MGIIPNLFVQDHEKKYMECNQIRAIKQQELKQYEQRVAKRTAQVKEAVKHGNNNRALVLSGGIKDDYKKMADLQKEIDKVDTIGMHAFSEMTDQRIGGYNIKGIVSYARQESRRLRKLEKPYAVELDKAADDLLRSRDSNSEAMNGIASEPYVRNGAQDVLEDIVASMQTEEKGKSDLKGKIESAAKEAEGA